MRYRMREFKKKFKALGMGCLVESGACPAFFSTVSVSVFFSSHRWANSLLAIAYPRWLQRFNARDHWPLTVSRFLRNLFLFPPFPPLPVPVFFHSLVNVYQSAWNDRVSFGKWRLFVARLRNTRFAAGVTPRGERRWGRWRTEIHWKNLGAPLCEVTCR